MSNLQVQSRRPIVAPQPQQKPQAPKAEAAEERSLTTKDVLKLSGKAAGGAAAGAAATWTYDLFFHFGNNGGTSYGGGVYAAGAAVGAAIGAGLGLRKYHKQQEEQKAQGR
ncbi:hypothetical protein D3C87_1575480 [compost metagenome]